MRGNYKRDGVETPPSDKRDLQIKNIIKTQRRSLRNGQGSIQGEEMGIGNLYAPNTGSPDRKSTRLNSSH